MHALRVAKIQGPSYEKLETRICRPFGFTLPRGPSSFTTSFLPQSLPASLLALPTITFLTLVIIDHRTASLASKLTMSQCPLGFKGTPPPGHPKVAGLENAASPSSSATDTTTGEKAGWNPWLLLLLDVTFILLAIYVARKGVPRAIADSVKAILGRTPASKVDGKVE